VPKVFTAPNPTEAHLLLGLLDAAGIEAEIRGEALFTTMKGASVIPGAQPEVWVPDPRQLDRALELVDRYQRGEVAALPGAAGWRCPDCGEEHEAQFTSCWKCGGGPA
jgi:hypothetical protein